MASIWDTLFPKQDYRTAAPSGGYADLYANSLLGNRTDAPTSVEAMQTGKDFIPGIGDAIALKEAYDAASRGDKVAAGLLTAGAALGLIPGAGDMVARPVMAAGRKAADVASRIEVDPNAVGSLLGNVRMKPKGDVADEIALFHGSPYDFRDFDLSQVGKGEGAQDLGRGFSLTDEEIVAHSYMNPASRWGDLEAMERYRQAGPGRTYEVAVKANPDQILDWKRPWKDQVPEGTPLYKKIQESMVKSYADDSEMQKLFQQANLSSAWRDDFGMEDAAIKSGFVGNKRKNFSGDTEFTIFDPSKMEMRKVFDNEGRQLPLSPPSPAEEIAGLLSSGRADDITDEMLGKLTAQDNSELFDLYQSGATGMDLPMDEASRMARADKMFPRKGFHGTNANIDGFRGNVFSSDNPTLASTYAKGSVDAQIYPLRLGSKFGDTVVEGGGADWGRLNISDVKDPSVAEWLDWAEGQKISTREIEQAASREGRSGVQFKDIKDTGTGFNSSQFKNLGYTKDQERDLRRQYMEELSKPSNVDVRLSPNLVRSRFARFDPRLANLKNLSAGVGAAPIGLLALREEQKRANEEQYKRGLLQ